MSDSNHILHRLLTGRGLLVKSEDVIAPGSRGGKFYRSATGRVRYGVPEREHVERPRGLNYEQIKQWQRERRYHKVLDRHLLHNMLERAEAGVLRHLTADGHVRHLVVTPNLDPSDRATKPWRSTIFDDRGLRGHTLGATAIDAVIESLYGADLAELHPGTVAEFEKQQGTEAAKQGNRRVVAMKRFYDLLHQYGPNKLTSVRAALFGENLDDAEQLMDDLAGVVAKAWRWFTKAKGHYTAPGQLNLFDSRKVLQPGIRGGHWRMTEKGDVRYDPAPTRAPEAPTAPPAPPPSPPAPMLRIEEKGGEFYAYNGDTFLWKHNDLARLRAYLREQGFEPPAIASPLDALTAQRESYRDAGRTRYLDMTPEQRRAVLPQIVRNANEGIEADRQFARGWLDEQGRATVEGNRSARQLATDFKRRKAALNKFHARAQARYHRGGGRSSVSERLNHDRAAQAYGDAKAAFVGALRRVFEAGEKPRAEYLELVGGDIDYDPSTGMYAPVTPEALATKRKFQDKKDAEVQARRDRINAAIAAAAPEPEIAAPSDVPHEIAWMLKTWREIAREAVRLNETIGSRYREEYIEAKQSVIEDLKRHVREYREAFPTMREAERAWLSAQLDSLPPLPTPAGSGVVPRIVLKAHVKEYTRTSKTGAPVLVHEHEDKRFAARPKLTLGRKPAAPQERHVTIHTAGPESPGHTVRFTPHPASPGKWTLHPADKERAKAALAPPDEKTGQPGAQASAGAPPAEPPIAQQLGMIPEISTLRDPHTPPPPGNFYRVDPTVSTNAYRVADAARVGVPAMDVPPPPPIPRLPNLAPDERAAESAFADEYERDPDGMAEVMIRKMQSGEIGDAPNIFGMDEAKKLSPHWNPKKASDADRLACMAMYNTAVHGTANAVTKRAFLRFLDEHVSNLPDGDPRKHVLVTAGGVASGKGYALGNIPTMNALSKQVGATWDSAGEQNSTELPWLYEQCRKRGIEMTAVFVHADPTKTWENPERGVVERAMKKGRMVDARVYADSYVHGPRNFKAFMESVQGQPGVYCHVLDNSGGTPAVLDTLPPSALEIDADALYKRALDYLNKAEVSHAIKRGGSAGVRIWGLSDRPQGQAPQQGQQGQRPGAQRGAPRLAAPGSRIVLGAGRRH